MPGSLDEYFAEKAALVTPAKQCWSDRDQAAIDDLKTVDAAELISLGMSSDGAANEMTKLNFVRAAYIALKNLADNVG